MARWVLVVLAAVIGVLVVSALRGGGTSLELVAPAAERRVVDLGDRGASLGDMTVFSGPVLEDDVRAGRIDGVCTITSNADVEDERRQRCEVTLTLGEGDSELQLAAVGRTEADDVVFSVVGGAGDHRGAGGEAVVDFGDGGRMRIAVALDG